MAMLRQAQPYSPIERVTELLHGVAITDPYRWLEDQNSQRTRAWLAAQTLYARSCLDAFAGRRSIRERIRELLDTETYDSVLKMGHRYIFRKRLVGQEQPSIFLREGADGPDQLLIDPAQRGTGKYTSVRPLRLSPEGRLLLYEIKQGGERAGSFELFDLAARRALPDALPHGHLRGFAFAPDSRSFYYVHERAGVEGRNQRTAYRHVLGTSLADDAQIFRTEGLQGRLHMVPGKSRLGFLVCRLLDKTYTDFYLWPLDSQCTPEPLIRNADFLFGPVFMEDGRLLAITNHEAPNLRIVDVIAAGDEPEFVDLVPATECRIQSWMVTRSEILVSYIRGTETQIHILDLHGNRLGQLATEHGCTVRLIAADAQDDEVLFEQESFTEPARIYRYSPAHAKPGLWASRRFPFDSCNYDHLQVRYAAQDGTHIPMALVGRRDVLARGPGPTVMTSYGGYGLSMTPQFSVLVAFLMERGCVFALPNIRGGAEFGSQWHEAAKRRHRQVAIDDFLSAAEWLIATGRTEPGKLAIFGGSTSGLLVGAAMTQRPELFRAVVCMVPMLDMLRYHLFDRAGLWRDELGTAEEVDDFAALVRYSPYHRVHDGTAYPATMIVSGDADQNCNPMHARKMTARLQAANASEHPIILDYRPQRGHSPVLPLSERVEALTDRLAFLCDQLELPL